MVYSETSDGVTEEFWIDEDIIEGISVEENSDDIVMEPLGFEDDEEARPVSAKARRIAKFKAAASMLGKHIKVQKRAFCVVPFEHHGIVSAYDHVRGRVKKVVHFIRVGDETLVQETDLDKFLHGKVVETFEIVEHSDSQFTSEQIVARARSHIGDKAYAVTKRNCEHLANWCHTNLFFSHQVRITGGTLLALLLLPLGIKILRRITLGLSSRP